MRGKIVRALGWGLGARSILLLFNFMAIIVTARILSPSLFGIYATAQIFIELGFAIASSALATPLIRTPGLTEEEERFAFSAFLAIAVVYSLLLLLLRNIISGLFQMPILGTLLLVISLIMPFRIMAAYYTSMLLQRMDLNWYQFSQIVPQLLGTLLTISAAIAGMGVWCLVAGFLATALIEFLTGFIKANAESRFPVSLGSGKRFLRVGSGSLAARFASFVVDNTDRTVTAAFIGASGLGLYTRAYAVYLIPFKVITLAAARIFLSAFSKIECVETRRRTLEFVLVMQAAVYIPLSGLFYLTSSFIVTLALGTQWIEAIPVCEILFGSLFARLGYEIIVNAFVAAGAAWITVWRIIYSMPVMILFTIMGYRWLGVYGVALGVSATNIIFYFVAVSQTCKYFNCAKGVVFKVHLVAAIFTILTVMISETLAQQYISSFVYPPMAELVPPLLFCAATLLAWACKPKIFFLRSWKEILRFEL